MLKNLSPETTRDRGSGVKPASAIRRTEQQILDDFLPLLNNDSALETMVLKYVNRQIIKILKS
jgi:hypothetical protein